MNTFDIGMLEWGFVILLLASPQIWGAFERRFPDLARAISYLLTGVVLCGVAAFWALNR